VHAPVPGTVVDRRFTALPDGRRTEAILIETSGSFDRLGRPEKEAPWQHKTVRQLLEEVEAFGVVDAEEPALPLQLRIGRAIRSGTKVLVIDASDISPYHFAALPMTFEHSPKLFQAIEILKKLLSPERTVVVSSAGEPAQRKRFEDLFQSHPNIETALVKQRFPQGNRGQLLSTLCGTEPGFAISVSTALALYDAIVLARPLIDRIITVGGGGVRSPANVKVRVGTSVADLLEDLGGLAADPERVILGDPFTGPSISDLSAPILKSTTAVICLTAGEVSAAEAAPCIRCGRCLSACPVWLEPIRLTSLLSAGRTEQAVEEGLTDCINCGACSAICPSRIPLAERIRKGKRDAGGHEDS
jgi:electron transport complex protein RnfC